MPVRTDEQITLLAAYDAQLRGPTEVQGTLSWDRDGPLYRAQYERAGFVSYASLGDVDDVDALIGRTVAFYQGLDHIEEFEWKTRGHDQPGGSRLPPAKRLDYCPKRSRQSWLARRSSWRWTFNFIAAAEEGVGNVSWVCLRAEDLPAGLGKFRVITFAQSFHWMDRPKVAAAARSMVEPNGAVVQVDPGRDGVGGNAAVGPHPPVPFQEIDGLRRRFLGPDRRAGQGRRNTSPSGEDSIFQAAGFLPEEQVRVDDTRVLDRRTDDLVAWAFSASSTAPHLFGNQLARFETDLRALLDQASPSGHFSVPLSDTTLRIRRPHTPEPHQLPPETRT